MIVYIIYHCSECVWWKEPQSGLWIVLQQIRWCGVRCQPSDNQGLPDWWSYPIPNVPALHARHGIHLIRTLTSTENRYLRRLCLKPCCSLLSHHPIPMLLRSNTTTGTMASIFRGDSLFPG